jgi:hypothetical protein
MSEKPNRARRSPQEKKRLSYERDRVNTYGESDKGSRKSIRRHKARLSRGDRRAATDKLKQVAHLRGDASQVRDDVAITELKALPRRGWQKLPDCPIGVLVDERPVKRHGAADRVRTRNVRAFYRLVIELNAQGEEDRYKWAQIRERRKKAEKALRKAKEKA